MLDADDKNVSAVFDMLTGKAVLINEEKYSLEILDFKSFVTLIYDVMRMKRLKASPANIPNARITEDKVMLPSEKNNISKTTVSILKSCSAISVKAGIFTYPSA